MYTTGSFYKKKQISYSGSFDLPLGFNLTKHKSPRNLQLRDSNCDLHL